MLDELLLTEINIVFWDLARELGMLPVICLA
jgi:hypothetical protein